MKKLLGILVLGLFLITPSWSGDIKRFQIEGISLGDSLLDYYSKSEIENWANAIYPSSDTFIGFETPEYINFIDYDDMIFYAKKEDINYKIYSMKGMKNLPNQLDLCLKKKKDLVKKVKLKLKPKDVYTYNDEYANAYGESKAYITEFEFIGGGSIRLWCTKFDKKHEIAKNWIDDFSFSINSKEYLDWLNTEAYKK